MDLVNEFVDKLGDLLKWHSSPHSTIPVVTLLQGIAAILGALISTLGFYKAWRYAERRLGHRLSDFLEHEERNLKLARESIKEIRGDRSAVRPNQAKIFTNDELKKALRLVCRRRFKRAETVLVQSLASTEKKETLARDKADLHEKQRAMAHLLLGAIEDRNGHHGAGTR